MLAIKLCSRLQITGRRRALIMFLVDNHLTFSRTATTKNLEDPEVIAEFAGIMKTPENLDALLLFTYCDTNGTAPDALEWLEGIPHAPAYRATLRFLVEGRENFHRKLDSDRQDLRSEVINLMPDEFLSEIKEHFDLTPSAAFAYREAFIHRHSDPGCQDILRERK